MDPNSLPRPNTGSTDLGLEILGSIQDFLGPYLDFLKLEQFEIHTSGPVELPLSVVDVGSLQEVLHGLSSP